MPDKDTSSSYNPVISHIFQLRGFMSMKKIWINCHNATERKLEKNLRAKSAYKISIINCKFSDVKLNFIKLESRDNVQHS